ncbi:ABC transporter permease [Fulvivirga sp.]|uniref:ABC transporter permease n=1 Tax=Fulvivirga sp. TaxID=1931237 RepID=UPI0032EB0910
MLKNYFKITLRNLLKHRVFTLINVAGLTLGLSVCLVILLYVKQELSYDTFHRNAENTYRILRIGNLNGEKYLIGVTSAPFADALINDYPQDIKSATRVFKVSSLVSAEGDKNFIENKLTLVDSNFFDTFNFPLEIGDQKTALALPNSIILTKATAKKYFGDEDPINKIIKVDNQFDYIVTGVFKETKQRSHIDFDFVGNWAPLRKLGFMSDWWSNGLYTYITLNDNTNPENLIAQFPAFMDKYFGEDFQKIGSRMDLTMQPLKEVYFQSEVQYDDVLHGNIEVIYIFIFIAIFIFVIACINFMNLATARSTMRAKEVGVRKALGSSKKSLIAQFFIESFMIAGAAVILAFTLCEVSLPLFNNLFSLELIPFRNIPVIVSIATALILFTGFVSGIYPALVLSSFKTVNVIKGKVTAIKGGLGLRKGLVVLQFGISIILIVFTLIVRKQLQHVNEIDLGFNRDKIVLLELNYNTINESIDTFKERLLNDPMVKNVSLSTGVPGGFHDTMNISFEGEEDNLRMRTLFTDENFMPSYELEILAGRNFSKDLSSDLEESVILNETAVKKIGWSIEDAINKRLKIALSDSTFRTVIGVVKDYNFSSLKTEVEPLIICMTDQASLLSIKLNSGSNSQQALAMIEDEWSKFVPFKPNYYFLDQSLQSLYEQEQLQSKIFQLFSGISIFVACLGIFGLASFTAAQRKKEIGVRKVLGASVQRISRLLATEYIKLVIISSAIALPLSWYFGDMWLNEFVYKTSLTPLTFIIGLVVAIFIAGVSVIFQSLKAAMANPVDSLKEE